MRRGNYESSVELNGLRELDVGERVALPLREEDVASLETENRADLGRIAAANSALKDGRTAEADSLLGDVAGGFGRSRCRCAPFPWATN